jgi:hypothetical protein
MGTVFLVSINGQRTGRYNIFAWLHIQREVICKVWGMFFYPNSPMNRAAVFSRYWILITFVAPQSVILRIVKENIHCIRSDIVTGWNRSWIEIIAEGMQKGTEKKTSDFSLLDNSLARSLDAYLHRTNTTDPYPVCIRTVEWTQKYGPSSGHRNTDRTIAKI